LTMGREPEYFWSRWLVKGTCWACHRPNRDHDDADVAAILERDHFDPGSGWDT
jgi:hypothetical protein